jgi:hypothetical protein
LRGDELRIPSDVVYILSNNLPETLVESQARHFLPGLNCHLLRSSACRSVAQVHRTFIRAVRRQSIFDALNPQRTLAFAALLGSILGHSTIAQQLPKDLPPPTTTSRNGTSCSGDTRDETQIAPGVIWTHYCRPAPVGGPWSIHVLQIDRHRRNLQVRSVAATDSSGQLARVPLTELATRAAAPGLDVLAIINGDFDFSEPFLGIPTGLAIADGRIWAAGGPPHPILGIFGSGRPAIGTPDVHMEARIGGHRLEIATLNRPLDFVKSHDLRLYTRAFHTSAKATKPFRAIVINQVNPPLPLSAGGRVTGVVAEIRDAATEQAIPENALLLADPEDTKDSRSKLRDLKPGMRVFLRLRITMEKQRGLHEAVAGTPVLVTGGHVAIQGEVTDYLKQRHPRTAVCFNNQSYMFVVVDGRQPTLSVGMTLDELANLMVSLGCTEALNTDGGGSAEMAVAVPSSGVTLTPDVADTTPDAGNILAAAPKLQIVNSPSDGPERGRPNAWIIITKH